MATITFLPLFEPQQLATAASPLFTAAFPTRIDKLTAVNTDAVARAVTFYWVPAGGAFGATNVIVSARPLQPGESWDVQPFMGHVLAAADQIFGFAAAAAVVNVFGSGVQVAS